MEQEEAKTTAAVGAEMPPEAESWVQLHESELTELMQKQAKAAITELKRQEKQEQKAEKAQEQAPDQGQGRGRKR